jgi:hypothetical protein
VNGRAWLSENVMREFDRAVEHAEREARSRASRFAQISGGRAVLASLLEAGAIQPDYAPLLQAWMDEGGVGNLTIRGVRIFPPTEPA